MKNKVPKQINGIPVHTDGEWILKRLGCADEKMITLRPDDEDDLNLWEFRVSVGSVIHTINGDGDIIR